MSTGLGLLWLLFPATALVMLGVVWLKEGRRGALGLLAFSAAVWLIVELSGPELAPAILQIMGAGGSGVLDQLFWGFLALGLFFYCLSKGHIGK